MTGCAKIRYRSRRAARREGRRIEPRTARLTAYRCDCCGFWHLTSQPTAVKTSYRRLARKD